eukprot:7640602-Alexandrium_andersonii.AAC.1
MLIHTQPTARVSVSRGRQRPVPICPVLEDDRNITAHGNEDKKPDNIPIYIRVPHGTPELAPLVQTHSDQSMKASSQPQSRRQREIPQFLLNVSVETSGKEGP